MYCYTFIPYIGSQFFAKFFETLKKLGYTNLQGFYKDVKVEQVTTLYIT